MGGIKIRQIEEQDIEQVLAIYAPYITDTLITFEETVPFAEAFRKRVQKITARYPWLVCEAEGSVVGYAYAGPYRERAAYDFTCELSVYVVQGWHSRGIGSLLYERLLQELRERGFVNAYAVITVPNAQSEALHRHFGFREEGRSRQIGYKMNTWCDVAYLSKRIGEGKRDADGKWIRPW